MTLKKKNIACTLTAICLIMGIPLFAQEADSLKNGSVEDAEILILKDRKLVMPSMEKIYEKSRFHDKLIAPELRPNIFKPYSYKLQKSKPNITAAKAKITKNPSPFNNYIKAGFGNYNSPLLKAGFTFPVNDNKIFGLHLNHLSFAKGAVDDENSASSMSSVAAYGKIIGREVAFTSELNFKSQTEYFYGYNESLVVNRDTIKQQFNFFNALASIADTNKKDEWGYDLSLQYRNVSDNFAASENTFSTISKLSYDNKLGIDFEVQISNYTDSNTFNRNYFRALPYYKMDIGEGKLDVGLSYSTQNDTTSVLNTSKIFPYLSAKYPLSEQIEAYASLDGGYNYNSYWNNVNSNPFLNSNLSIENEELNYDFKLGIKATVSEQFNVALGIGAQSVANKSYFANSLIDSTKFDILYLAEPTSITTLLVKLSYQLNESHLFNLNLDIANYSNPLEKVLHLPRYKLELNGQHQLSSKFRMGWNFYSLSGIEVSNSNNKTLSIQNLKIATHYAINNNLKAFLELDNMLNKNYERYLNYMQRGVQIKVGFLYKF